MSAERELRAAARTATVLQCIGDVEETLSKVNEGLEG